MRKTGRARVIGWLAATVAAASAAACAGPAEVTVDDAWVRLPAVPGRPAAAYFTLNGGPEPDVLVRVTADYAIRAEMHETMSGGGRMSMTAIGRVPVPARGTVSFEPGGRHVMLYGIDPRAKPGTTTLLTLTFGDGSRLYRKAFVVSAGADSPH